jgi:3-mercaptopyruvate sulfurtransferase SseA
LGYENVSVLKGGFANFKKDILEFKNPGNAKTKLEADDYKFREEASVQIPVLIEKSKTVAVPVKKSKRIIGGC